MLGVLLMRVGDDALSAQADEMQARKVMEALVISAAGTVIASIACNIGGRWGAPQSHLGQAVRGFCSSVSGYNSTGGTGEERSQGAARPAQLDSGQPPRLGVSRQTVSAWRPGVTTPPLPWPFCIARVSATIGEIFFPDDRPLG